ncbi:thiol-disulfide oxidoreductase DCC family protein [Niastella caeni]|uniref:Thiol-disulfide oxidoreductase DCC family protein n=1 Tax=Niastella caeni TaxID=2569763 RepID=A0A4S8HZE3_9BACT|nr:thiol-disulfide oxidoreductase DCC family protein [Niastella caeni]THU40751.1 thiol-disulfide oxidoreductase DCC family protein [Niastella caeni]
MISTTSKYIVLFDGVCNLCDSSVQFVLKRDKKKKFLFGSLQGKTGQEYLRKYHLPADQFHSFMLIEGNVVYTRSTAMLRLLKHLGRGWQLLYAFIYVPQPIRDGLYKLIAANRYRLFGKKESCRVPTQEERDRFLE